MLFAEAETRTSAGGKPSGDRCSVAETLRVGPERVVVMSAVLRDQITDTRQGFGKRQGAGREAARIRLPRQGHGLGSRLPLDPGCWD